MTVRENVLSLLEQHRGQSLSGAELAARLGVSRNAVWKAVQALREAGYPIEAGQNRGYALSEASDLLSPEGVAVHLRGEARRCDIHVYPELASTNITLKQLGAEGAPEGTVVIAETQTQGRGRMGRSFHSPPGSGLYMSILLRPGLSPDQALFITTAAAVAVARAIEAVAPGQTAEIKWVNDVYCRGKKVCGILTEASLDMESGGLEYAVLGIGVNMTVAGFPPELEGIATHIFDGVSFVPGSRGRLAAEILNAFFALYPRLSDKSFLPEYRRRSMIVGRDIVVISGEHRRDATALAIDDEARLVVRYSDGSTEALGAGEVSIRRKDVANP